MEDISHSQQMKGVFCCIVDAANRHVGVLDFVPEIRPKTACLALLMIGTRSRNLGYGATVVKELEAYLKRSYGTESIESGVQVNNPDGIGFWRKMGFSIGTEARAMGDGTVAYEMKRKVE